MPYELRKQDGGYKVGKKGSSKTFSKKPMSKKKAMAQLAALHINAENVIMEGPHDQGIFKAVFMAGGPGSGKGYISADLFGIDKSTTRSMSTLGLKVINLDHVREFLLKQKGYSLKDIDAIPKDVNDKIWIASRVISAHLMKQMMSERKGLIIDSTGSVPGMLRNQKELLEKYGYDTLLIFVDTPLEIALANNRKRQRVLPDETVTKSWNKTQAAKNELLSIFPNHIVITNDGTTPISNVANKKAQSFINAPIKNPTAKRWLAYFNVK